MWISMNYGHDIPEAELRAFQDGIVSQDVPPGLILPLNLSMKDAG